MYTVLTFLILHFLHFHYFAISAQLIEFLIFVGTYSSVIWNINIPKLTFPYKSQPSLYVKITKQNISIHEDYKINGGGLMRWIFLNTTYGTSSGDWKETLSK